VTLLDRGRIILAKTAWSERYDSLGQGDDPVGNHRHLGTGAGHEAYNFKPSPKDNRYYGYFRAHGGVTGGGLNLRRIDNLSSRPELDSVSVIWVSRPPEGGLRVVGWYRNAKVFEETRNEDSPWSHPLYRTLRNTEGKGSYVCSAPTDGSALVPITERERLMLPKPVSRLMGRTDVLYPRVDAHSGHVAQWVGEMEGVIDRIERYKRSSSPSSSEEEDREAVTTSYGQGLSPDPKHRAFVEKTAMDHAKRHFESRGYMVTDVSKKDPFDLECQKDGENIQVEVKGTSGDGTRVILTEREFRHVPPSGWEKALYVLPQITELEGGGVITGEQQIIIPFNPQSYESKPISHLVRLESQGPGTA
jgi:hypothetical protein